MELFSIRIQRTFQLVSTLFEVRSYDGYITQRLSAGNGKVFVRIKEDEKPFKPWPIAAQ